MLFLGWIFLLRKTICIIKMTGQFLLVEILGWIYFLFPSSVSWHHLQGSWITGLYLSGDSSVASVCAPYEHLRLTTCLERLFRRRGRIILLLTLINTHTYTQHFPLTPTGSLVRHRTIWGICTLHQLCYQDYMCVFNRCNGERVCAKQRFSAGGLWLNMVYADYTVFCAVNC